MKLFFLLFFSLAHTCIAQQVDTIWYNNKWEKSDKDQSAFYRVIKQNATGHYLVRDFFSSGEIQMEGLYLSLNPDVKDGDFVYWSKDGKKEMDISFKKDTTERYIKYDSEGKIKEQRAYVTVPRYIDGKQVLERVYLDALPQFPGGKEALNAFIRQNIKYPASLAKKGISGRVVIKFVINEKGQVTTPTITQGADPVLNKEAVRIVKMMPDWVPGKLNGKSVRVSHELPIVFQL